MKGRYLGLSNPENLVRYLSNCGETTPSMCQMYAGFAHGLLKESSQTSHLIRCMGKVVEYFESCCAGERIESLV